MSSAPVGLPRRARSGGLALGFGIVVAIAAAFGLGMKWMKSQPGTQAPALVGDRSMDDEVARLRLEVDALKGKGAMPVVVPKASSAPRGQELPVQDGEFTEASEGLPSLESVRLAERARVEAARARMDLELESEARDRAFERSIEEQLTAVYANGEFAGTRMASLECRTTLCRIASTHETPEAMAAFGRNAAKYPPFNTEVFYSYEEGESLVSNLYVARPGVSLPHDF